VAAELNENLGKLDRLNRLNRLNQPAIRGMSNRDAAKEGEILISTLPHAGHIEILSGLKAEIAGKILITATIAWPPGRPEVPSAAEEAQGVLGTSARVVAAFQTVSAGTLQTMDSDHQEDVLICSDDKEAAEATRLLVDETGLRGILAGPLERARLTEAITGFLLKINRRYGVKSTGIRITGIEGK
jgi:NADPH-dependent F420 reductase